MKHKTKFKTLTHNAAGWPVIPLLNDKSWYEIKGGIETFTIELKEPNET